MRIAIVHYHLRPGGVTRVIRSTIAGLATRDIRFVVLTGEMPSGDAPHTVLVDGLGYADTPQLTSSQLRDRMESAARAALGGEPDVWHIHNHSLGKNSALTAAVADMARAGRRLLLHIHDFPEDGRPENYWRLMDQLGNGSQEKLRTVLYPFASHVHYAALNHRDHAFLSSAGVAPQQLHLLPNPVQPLTDVEEPAAVPPAANRLFLYPTRAIRRKNIGEFLFWAAVAPTGDRFATTLAPTNPTDVVPYKRWIRFAQENQLPVEFEVGSGGQHSYADIVRSASALVTTSIAEGFGLAFTEPWLAGRALIGRNLPEITHNLVQSGMDLGSLYNRLEIPLEWVGIQTLRSRVADRLKSLWSAYRRTLPPHAVDQALDAMSSGDRVDFGRLDEAMQERIILRLRSDRSAVANCVPTMLTTGEATLSIIEKNRRIVGQRFSLANYAERLVETYQATQGCEVGAVQTLDEQKLLEHFLAPQRFHLLRS